MESTLTLLNEHLEKALEVLHTENVKQELHESLHNHNEGVLPSIRAMELANKTIDSLHKIEQLLEPGNLVLADHFLGYVDAKCLVAAVEFKIPDQLEKNGQMQVENLAKACQARPDRLHQVMRVLACNGIFNYDEKTRSFSNNSTSTLLLSDHSTQWKNWVELYGNQFYDMARGIPGALKEDAVRCPAQINFDTELNMFNYFEQAGWLPQLHKTLGAGAIAQAPGILADYPWAEVSQETIIDIGGGGGNLISLLLRGHESMKGGVYDLPAVIEHITPFFHNPDGQFYDLRDRVPVENLVAGDFFSYVPPSKVYTMKWCLHDWKDDKALKILRNIRKAIIPGPKSRLIVMESILGLTRSQRLSRYADMNMMITANGLERSLADWERLAEESGWKISKLHTLRNAWPCAIDMRLA